MQLTEQPLVLNQLEGELRAAAQLEAAITIAERLRLGIPTYCTVLLVIWMATNYRHDHLTTLLATSVAMMAGLVLRAFAISVRPKIHTDQTESWFRLVTLSILLIAG